MKLDFSYTMVIEFDNAVHRQFFAMRCIPQSNLRQRIERLHVEVLPDTKVNYRTDGYGNRVMEGSIWEESGLFSVMVEGQAETLREELSGIQTFGGVAEESAQEYDAAFYRQTTGLTSAGAGLSAYAELLREQWDAKHMTEKQCGGAFAGYIMHSLHDKLQYRQFTTDVNTTAEQAFADGGGVCQDYAHIMIALLRIFDIPSRYVVGIMKGEGMSHAWVEVLLGEYWYGYDPTNDCVVTANYIKFSHGRDYRDCRINRGIFAGCAMQRQQVEAVVSEHEQ